MAFIVNSSPGAGLRFQPSESFRDAAGALDHAIALSRRGMRQVKIRNIETGEIFDERSFRQHLNAIKAAADAAARAE